MRDHFLLDPTVTFLNHGSFGAIPRKVLEAQRFWQSEIEKQPVEFMVRRLPIELGHARERAARFLGADPGGLAFVRNATTGVNAVLGSLTLREGDHVLTSQHRYDAVANALARNSTTWGARVDEVRVPFPLRNSEEIIAVFEAAWTPTTRLLVIDHITSPTALIMPVRALTELAHERGAQVLVDAAHAPGQLDVQVDDLGVDYWTGNLHKWVCAPRGAALLWVAAPHREHVHHPVTSLGWGQGYPAEFDWTGTDDPSPWLASTTAMDLHDSWGGAILRASNHALVREGRALIARTLNVQLPHPDDPSFYGSMATIPLPGRPEDAQAIWNALIENHRIEVPVIAWDDRLWVRISGYAYNRPEDYQRLAEALSTVCAA